MELVLGLGILAILGYACFELLRLLVRGWRHRRSIARQSATWPSAGRPRDPEPTVRRTPRAGPPSDADLIAQVRVALPRLPASEVAIEAAEELLRLQRDIGVALDSGLPAVIGERLVAEAALATEVLWGRIERLLAVGTARSDSLGPSGADAVPPAVRDALAADAASILRLVEAIREARAGLAEVTLADEVGQYDATRALGRLRALGDAVRALNGPGPEIN